MYFYTFWQFLGVFHTIITQKYIISISRINTFIPFSIHWKFILTKFNFPLWCGLKLNTFVHVNHVCLAEAKLRAVKFCIQTTLHYTNKQLATKCAVVLLFPRRKLKAILSLRKHARVTFCTVKFNLIHCRFGRMILGLSGERNKTWSNLIVIAFSFSKSGLISL